MRTLLPDPPPAELQALLERRRRLGQDGKDEVWEGVLHMVPGPAHRHGNLSQQLAVILDAPARAAGLEPMIAEFNLGDSKDDFRIPDGGLHRPGAAEMWHPTAALVLDYLDPTTRPGKSCPSTRPTKLNELLIVDPDTRQVHWLGLTSAGRYEPIERSALIDLGPAELDQRLDWP